MLSCGFAGGGGDLVRVVADGLGLNDSLETVTNVLGFLNSGIDVGISGLEVVTEIVVGGPPARNDPVAWVDISLPAVEVVKAVPKLVDVNMPLVDTWLDAVRVIQVSVEADTFGTGISATPVVIPDAKVFDEELE